MRWPLAVAAALVGCATPVGPASTLARARALVGESRGLRGELSLRCEPADAQVAVDGVARGLCSDFGPGTEGLSTGAGMHRIEISKEGFLSDVTWYEPSGARAALTISLSPAATNQGAL